MKRKKYIKQKSHIIDGIFILKRNSLRVIPIWEYLGIDWTDKEQRIDEWKKQRKKNVYVQSAKNI
jgi:hypothetical protein